MEKQDCISIAIEFQKKRKIQIPVVPRNESENSANICNRTRATVKDRFFKFCTTDTGICLLYVS